MVLIKVAIRSKIISLKRKVIAQWIKNDITEANDNHHPQAPVLVRVPVKAAVLVRRNKVENHDIGVEVERDNLLKILRRKLIQIQQNIGSRCVKS
jgi:hypothetical protein